MTDKKAVEIPVTAKEGEVPDNKAGASKKNDNKKAAELSAEDERIKGEVELLVTRCCDPEAPIAANALQMLSVMLRTASGSVGSVPKPLKFVRTMWDQLTAGYDATKDDTNKRAFADLLSFIAMTKSFTDEERVVLKYRLKGNTETTTEWGHEYLRFLAGEVAKEWTYREENEETEGVANVEELRPLSDHIMRYMMQHQDESTACDLAIETDNSKFIINYCDENNFVRVAQYVVAVAEYLLSPENTEALSVAYEIYVKFKALPAALRIALALHDNEKVKALFAACEDKNVKAQMALICGRYRLFIDHEDDETLEDYNGNTKLSEQYLAAAKELDALAPKKAEDIFKDYLVDKRLAPTTTNSYVHNLATTFVSAFANAGFGKDELLDKDNTWIFQNKEHRMMSAAASLGLVHLWDHGDGLTAVDRYSYSEEPLVRAGVALANGIVMCGVKSPFDPALGLLADKIADPHRETRVGAILGLGYAYAGTHKEDIKELLMPIVADGEQPTEVQAFAAYAMALVFPGSCDEDISEAIVSALMEKSDQQLVDVTVRYMILALGCLFLSQQDKADTLLEATQAFSPVIQKFTEVVVGSCAYAGSGNVVQIQKMFSLIAEQEEEDDEDEKKEETDDLAPPKPLNHKAAAVLAIGLIAMGERLGTDMCKRSLIHILTADHVKKGEAVSGRAALPLAYALLSPSETNMSVIEILHKLSHDADVPTAMNAILGMGVVAAGTNNARVATMLRNLSGYYHKEKDSNLLFTVRIAQGLTALGKGHLTLNPMQSDNLLLCPSALTGLLGLMHSALEMEKTLLDTYHYMFFSIVPALNPRMLLTISTEGEVVKAQSRVGIPVDTVTVPGKPKTVTGFQTQATPLILTANDRAEIVGKHKALTPVIEGIVIVEEKPEAE